MADQIINNEVVVIVDQGIPGAKGDTGLTGATGKSAYQTAVDNGFVGTEAEWYTSLTNPSWNNVTNKPLVFAADIDDINVSESKPYSGSKTQSLHDAQAQAIANLSTAQCSFKNEATPSVSPITTVNQDMAFTVLTNSNNTDIIEIDDTSNTITLKKNAKYNFLSTITLESSTNSAVNLTFDLINVSNSTVYQSQVHTAEIQQGDKETIPMNTLLNVTIAPLTLRIQVRASATGYALNGFNSILASAASYESIQLGKLPIGGTTGQVLVKLSDNDYDVGWTTI
jgi:hypothetical protein